MLDSLGREVGSIEEAVVVEKRKGSTFVSWHFRKFRPNAAVSMGYYDENGKVSEMVSFFFDNGRRNTEGEKVAGGELSGRHCIIQRVPQNSSHILEFTADNPLHKFFKSKIDGHGKPNGNFEVCLDVSTVTDQRVQKTHTGKCSISNGVTMRHNVMSDSIGIGFYRQGLHSAATVIFNLDDEPGLEKFEEEMFAAIHSEELEIVRDDARQSDYTIIEDAEEAAGDLKAGDAAKLIYESIYGHPAAAAGAGAGRADSGTGMIKEG